MVGEKTLGVFLQDEIIFIRVHAKFIAIIYSANKCNKVVKTINIVTLFWRYFHWVIILGIDFEEGGPNEIL